MTKAVRQWLLASRSLENWHTDCGQVGLNMRHSQINGRRTLLYCRGVGAIVKQNCSASNTNHKFLGCSHAIKIEAMTVPINASKDYVQDDCGSIF